MKNKNTRWESTQEIVYKNCHSKSGHYLWPRPIMFLYGVLESHHLLLSKVRSRIKYGMTALLHNNQEAGDPRQNSSGMTSNLMSGSHLTYKDALNKVYRLGGSPTGAASKLWDTCHKAGNLSGLHPTYKGQRGFTLIELLVVVLIIGMLVAVALPQYQKAVEKAKTTEIITALDAAEKAFSAYYLEHGRFQGISQETLPMKLPELTHFKYQVGTSCSANDATTSNKFEGPYNGYRSTYFTLYFCDKKEKGGVELQFNNSNITKRCQNNASICKYLNL